MFQTDAKQRSAVRGNARDCGAPPERTDCDRIRKKDGSILSIRVRSPRSGSTAMRSLKIRRNPQAAAALKPSSNHCESQTRIQSKLYPKRADFSRGSGNFSERDFSDKEPRSGPPILLASFARRSAGVLSRFRFVTFPRPPRFRFRSEKRGPPHFSVFRSHAAVPKF